MSDKPNSLKHPKFGDRIRGNFAGEDNPQRDGYFVRVVRRTGRLNPGVWYECTDGKGNFWYYEGKNTTRLESLLPAETDKATVSSESDGLRASPNHTGESDRLVIGRTAQTGSRDGSLIRCCENAGTFACKCNTFSAPSQDAQAVAYIVSWDTEDGRTQVPFMGSTVNLGCFPDNATAELLYPHPAPDRADDLSKFAADLARNQERLGPEIERIIAKNLHNFLDGEPTPAAIGAGGVSEEQVKAACVAYNEKQADINGCSMMALHLSAFAEPTAMRAAIEAALKQENAK